MVLPLVLYILGFSLVPVLETIRLSFVNASTNTYDLSNYVYIMSQQGFKKAFSNTIVITIVGLALQLSVALSIALLLKRAFKGRGFFRTVMLIPMGVPTIVAGVIMLYVFSTNGYFNLFLQRFNIIEAPIIWNEGGFKTLFMIIFADMWKVLPIVILLLLSGLESISEDVYEASAIDGATTWQNFWYITLPLLKPAITMALILRAIDAFRIFELPLVLAGRHTPVIGTYAYSEYRDFFNEHTSAAAATILLLMIIVFIIIYFLFVERKKDV
nr:sugar ABC transporter permease [Caldalkalibacillus salinus]